MVLFVIRLIMQIASIMGMWNIFIKLGRKGYYAIIPVVRKYLLADAVGKHVDGFFIMIFDFIMNFFDTILVFVPEESDEYILFSLLSICAMIPNIVFSVRVCCGVCDAFGAKRLWVFLIISDYTEWIFYFVFGFSKKRVPLDKFIKSEESFTAGLSGVSVSGDGTDLSVNIRERSVLNFFKKFTLLRDIHINIPKGHMVLLLDGSGAGKTTFLNAVTGYEKADADIELGKWNVYRDYGKMKYDIGFVPQQDLMRGNDTVYRTISDAASLRLISGMTSEDKKKRVSEVLEIFGLTALSKTLVSKLSGGQRKRLSIAIEYISYPTLFILDEPDSGLDGVVARNLFEKLREIADTGKIVMVITHTPDRVIDLFDDVIVLAKDSERTGRLAYYGPIDESYEFFGKRSMEEILLSINQKEEGGEGRAEEYVSKYNAKIQAAGGEA